MSIKQEMEATLNDAFAPVEMRLVDQSHLHEGHAGHDGRGESHFKLTMTSAKFSGVNRVNRQRMVHEVLDSYLKGRVHALAMILRAPEDA